MRPVVELFVRRPVAAFMVAALLVTLGWLSFRGLGLDLMPDVDLPIVSVSTILRGAGPEEVEAGVTRPLEEVINTIEGIDELRSSSYEGRSRVSVTFDLERDAFEAAQDVRDKVAAVVGRLPEGCEAPVITRFDTEDFPVLGLTVSGNLPMRVLTDIARRTVKESIETLPGVGAVEVVGGETRAVEVRLDADRLAAFDLPVTEVARALASENAETAGGRVDMGEREAFLRTLGRVERVPDFGDIFVSKRGGVPVLLKDVATVVDGLEDPSTLARYQGRRAVTVQVRKQSGANTVAVVDEVFARVDRLRQALPAGVSVDVVRDQSDFVRRSVQAVEHHLLLGAAFTALTVLLFLRSWRTTLVAALSIPASLVATFTVMRWANFTLNNMTLLALTVATGIVIDDAIVVLENILRHARDLGKSAVQAAIDGTSEVSLAVTATTFSLAVIFLPTAFLEGRIGRFFFSFGITLTAAVLVSLLVAMVLTPPFTALAAGRRGLGGHAPGRLYRAVDTAYGGLLAWALRHRGWVAAGALLLAASSVPLYLAVGKDFMPNDDRSEFIVAAEAPEGTSLQGAETLFAELEDRLRKLPEVRGLLTTLGEGGNRAAGTILVQLTDLEDRDVSQFEIMRMARKALAPYARLRPSIQHVLNRGGGSRGGDVNLTIRSFEPEDLDAFLPGYLEAARAIPGLVDVDSTAAVQRPEVRVHLDRRRAADLGARASDVGGALATLVGGSIATRYREGDEVMDVWLRLDRPFRGDPSILHSVRIPAASGTQLRLNDAAGSVLRIPSAGGTIPLSSVATLEQGLGPVQIDRIDRLRQVTVYANLVGLDLGAALDAMRSTFQRLDPPPTLDAQLTGRSKAFADAYVNFAVAFALSLLFMYMILAAQFESLLLPVPILMALPLAMPFALVTLLALGDALNVYSIFGLFLLAGVVKKNGILQVDRTLQLEAEGMGRIEAILLANHQRLRPILMTTLTLIAGMLPIALGQGPGAANRASMAKVIVFGQALSLAVTLLITPVTYSLLRDAADKMKARIAG
ncbi:MAG: efflux RND transporter permease subunit [Deltaproteobacteria bacterium]|nr:efflux RND transporter permease subunit [Deltaproteobacteria bacterium]